jgi:hypothetical protein
VGQAKREAGHVEGRFVSLRPEPQREDRVDRDATGGRPAVAVEERPGDLPDEIRGKALVARRDRRVDREDAVALRASGRVEILTGGDDLARPLGEQRRGWPSLRCPTAGSIPSARRTVPAEPQHEDSWETHLAAADIQDVGDRPVGVPFWDVRIEREHRRQPTWTAQTAM